MKLNKKKKRIRAMVVLAAIVVGGFLGFKGADLAASIYFFKAGNQVNGWFYYTDWMTAKPPSLKAAAYVKHAMFSHLKEEAVFYITGGNTSDGKRFKIHFAADELPKVKAFWSLTMYYDYIPHNLVKNPINRFTISDRTPGIQFNSDGSLDIYLQHKEPEQGHKSNWLPTPDGAFKLVLRAYMPGDEIREGRYAPPPLTKVNGAKL